MSECIRRMVDRGLAEGILLIRRGKMVRVATMGNSEGYFACSWQQDRIVNDVIFADLLSTDSNDGSPYSAVLEFVVVQSHCVQTNF